VTEKRVFSSTGLNGSASKKKKDNSLGSGEGKEIHHHYPGGVPETSSRPVRKQEREGNSM